MSLGYSIAATLHEDFSKENIQHILETGKSLGFIYYKYISGDLNIYSIPLSIEDAFTAIQEGYKKVDMYCITVEIEKTYFNLNFIDENNRLVVMFPGLNDLWSRSYKNKEFGIDIERYLKVFLGLVHDYQIENLSVEYD